MFLHCLWQQQRRLFPCTSWGCWDRERSLESINKMEDIAEFVQLGCKYNFELVFVRAHIFVLEFWYQHLLWDANSVCRSGLTQSGFVPRSPLIESVRTDVFADEVFHRARMCLDTCCVFSRNHLSCLSTSKMSLMEKDRGFYVSV